MDNLKKFQGFLTDLSEKRPEDKFVLETILKASNAIFEANSEEFLIVDSMEADQVSTALKNIEQKTNIEKEKLNDIYRLFIRMDKNKLNQPFSDVFQKLKVMLVKLSKKEISTDEIVKFLGQYV